MSGVNTTMEERSGSTKWPMAMGATITAVILITVLFQETARSIVEIWIRSETFAHGFLIIPIVIWLIWDKRRQVRRLTPKPEFRVLILLPVFGFGWLIANLIDVQVVQQLAFVSILILAVWVILGNALARSLSFPLFFLFFAVPIGEGLIIPMMNFTADFTVAMLKLTGIPVYREGTFFSIPSGNWSVVEGCSGVRYLIASVTLGVLYAYLTYTRLHKRILFIIFAFLVPVIANGLRAYMIVMIAHLSDMKLALGVDHLIYGWVFFGIVIFIMFVVGSFWRDDYVDDEQGTAPDQPAQPRQASTLIKAALLSTLLAAIWPAIAYSLATNSDQLEEISIVAPIGSGGWKQIDQSHWDWQPHIIGTDGEFYQFYKKGDDKVGLYLGVYREQRQDAELINSQNFMVEQKHSVWSNKWEMKKEVDLQGRKGQVIQSRLDSRRLGLTSWHWYRLGDQYSSNPYVAKLLEAVARLTGSRRDAAMLVLATPYQRDPEDAAPVLQDFLSRMLPGMEASIDRAVGQHE